MRDFDDNDFPLAYLISLRTYGTWLHGDKRGSMDRKHNVYGTSKIEPNPSLHKSDSKQLRHPPVTLNVRQRPVVEKAIKEVCNHRLYVLRAINVRTNHVHTVVSAMQDPEPVLEAFKAYATRALRRAKLLTIEIKPWVRHAAQSICGRRKMWLKPLSTCFWGKEMICFGWTTMSDYTNATPSLMVGLLPPCETFAKGGCLLRTIVL
jgi:REP element-mobilizing transposase RayT